MRSPQIEHEILPSALKAVSLTSLPRCTDPSVSAKVFSTFNCELFDGEYDGSNSWMRADLSVDCNAPERTGWICYAVVMICIFPLGIPSFFAFLLLVRFKSTLDEQRDKEQLHIDTQKAVGHGTRLQGRREEEERKSALGADRPSSRWSSAARSSRRSAAAAGAPMDVTAVVTALKRNSPAARSTAGTEPAKETRQGVTAVYAETADVLKDLEGMCTTSADRTRDLH